jgi:hypothetical protein
MRARVTAPAIGLQVCGLQVHTLRYVHTITDLCLPLSTLGSYPQGVIEDTVLLPKDLPAGDYVLGWRYDCEETAQIWQSCADVAIAAAE